jgi:hypothetical protein
VERRLDICIDGYVEGERFDPAELPAPVDLRRASHDELAMAWAKQWQPGQELRIRFLDGEPELQEQVEQHARTWLDHANLGFSFGNHPDAEIRITFDGDGYSSLVGTDALRQPQSVRTMELAFLPDTPEEEIRRTVLHEFGHAIGCVHEQASPAVEIPWDMAKVKEYYRRWQGWDDETIERNVLHRYSSEETRFTEHDPHSIMQYPVPEELTIGDFAIGWNNELSELDKSFVARMYPR